jgi:lysophospholipase L1-like esterase
MRRAVAATVTVCAVGLLLPGAAAAAHSAPKVTPGSTYLAIGDSVSFGYQEPQVQPAPNYGKASTFLGFPEHAARALRLKVSNAACPGETSSSFLNPSAQSFGCENYPGNPNIGYRKFYPLHVRYSGGQMAYALSFLRNHPKTRLISLMIGANDFFVCQATTSDGCASQSEREATLATLSKNVRTILSSIRNKAKYRGQIVVMRYYSLDYGSPLISGQSQILNSTLIGAAKPFGVAVADGYGQFKSASAQSAGKPCQAGLLTQLGDPGSCGVHPSFSGQGMLALALARAIRL